MTKPHRSLGCLEITSVIWSDLYQLGQRQVVVVPFESEISGSTTSLVPLLAADRLMVVECLKSSPYSSCWNYRGVSILCEDLTIHNRDDRIKQNSAK